MPEAGPRDRPSFPAGQGGDRAGNHCFDHRGRLLDQAPVETQHAVAVYLQPAAARGKR